MLDTSGSFQVLKREKRKRSQIAKGLATLCEKHADKTDEYGVLVRLGDLRDLHMTSASPNEVKT